MTPPTDRIILQRIALDSRASLKARLHALERLKALGASARFLNALLTDPTTHPRVRAVAYDMRKAKDIVRAWNKRENHNTSVLGT